MLVPLLGLGLGLIIGALSPLSIPPQYAKLFTVALLAALDTVFGGLRAAAEEKFDNTVFTTGFFTNAFMAAVLVFVGDGLGIDLYYVALLAFGLRIFQNLAIIRRYFLKK